MARDGGRLSRVRDVGGKIHSKEFKTDDADDNDCARARVRLPSTEVVDRERFVGDDEQITGEVGAGGGNIIGEVLIETWFRHVSIDDASDISGCGSNSSESELIL